jgi:hypothetical protein
MTKTMTPIGDEAKSIALGRYDVSESRNLGRKAAAVTTLKSVSFSMHPLLEIETADELKPGRSAGNDTISARLRSLNAMYSENLPCDLADEHHVVRRNSEAIDRPFQDCEIESVRATGGN